MDSHSYSFLCCRRFRLAADEVKPNVIVILADDIGYGDLGCYGATRGCVVIQFYGAASLF